MFDQSFTIRNISRQLRKSDFVSHNELRLDAKKKLTVERAVEFSLTSHFIEEDFREKKVKGKPVYQLADFYKELVQRKVNSNVKRFFRIKQNDRDVIVNQLTSLLKEQIPYHVHRLDIRRFYESIDLQTINQALSKEPTLSYRTKNFIINFVRAFQSTNNTGLPRGIALSASLSELIMRDFDNTVIEHKDVFYYARYVDDIVIVTSTKEGNDFVNFLETLLPTNLYFNTRQDGKGKRELIKTVQPKSDQSFSYLGYKFIVKKEKKSTKTDRKVTVDISNSKTKKIKTRLIKSFAYYQRFGDFRLLQDRVRLLTSNFSLLDKKKEVHVMSGIYYNYKRVDFEESISLVELDSALRNIIFRDKNFVGNNTYKLNKKQKRELLRNSFKNGFVQRKRVYFSPTRQQKLQRTWRDDK